MNQDHTQLDVAPLTDAEQLRLTAGRVLRWHDAKPCCELSTLAKCSTVTDGVTMAVATTGPIPGDLADAGTPCIACRYPFQLIVEFFNLLLNELPLIWVIVGTVCLQFRERESS
jgi:hypothetical protein